MDEYSEWAKCICHSGKKHKIRKKKIRKKKIVFPAKI